jgi:hypothetical protein
MFTIIFAQININLKMPRGGTAGGSKKTSNIQFQRPSEPSFLKRIKEQVGYKEAVTIESKVKYENIIFWFNSAKCVNNFGV